MGQLNRHLKPINAELKRKLWPEKLESENKMNERIEKLARQAGFDLGNGQTYKVENFAELIVQECLFIIDDERKPNMVDRVELWKQIKEHFGVKS